MIGKLVNEWRVLRWHPMIWVALIGVALFSAAAVRGSPTDPEEGSAAVILWLNMLYPMFMLPFVAGALAPIFYLREVDHDMGEIVGSYPMTPRAWMAVRVASFTLLMLVASLLSQLLSIALLVPQFPGETATMLVETFKWLVVLQLPNCLLWASFLGWIASRKAQSGVVYFTSGMIWLAYNGLAAATGSSMLAGSVVLIEPLHDAMLLLDPYAATSLMGAVPETGLLQSRELNVTIGRLFWLGVVFVLLRGVRNVPMLAERKVANKGARIRTMSNWQSHVGFHLRYMTKDKVFALMVLGWVALMLPEVIGGMDWVEPYSRVEPDSRDALNRVMWDVVPNAGFLLLLYLADRVCRLYSSTGMQELYGATPHASLRLVAVQLVSLFGAAAFFVILAGLAVLVGQLVHGVPVDPTEYTVQLGVTFSGLALFVPFLVAYHGLIRQRFVANLAGLATIVLSFSPLLPLIGLVHPLWRPLATPVSRPDHYWGYGESLSGHWQFLLIAAAVGFAAVSVAIARHHRTQKTPNQKWSKALRQPVIAVAALGLAVAGWQGASIDRTLRSEGAAQSNDDRYAWRAAYERDYSSWADVAQPDLEKIEARVDFRPSEQRANIRAELILLNRSDVPIRKLLVGRNQIGVPTLLRLEGATIEVRDDRAGQTVFAFDTPLVPGDRATLAIEMTVSQSSLTTASFPHVLRPEFNSLPAYAMLPLVGFRKEVLLRDTANRDEQGLAPLEISPPSKLGGAGDGSLARDRVMLDAVVSTEASHEAIGQGALVRRWQESGRNYFQYSTTAPIRALPAFFSVPWKRQRFTQGQVDFDVFAPVEIAADDLNVLGMRDAVELLGREIAPYGGTSLSLLSTPEIGPTGFALPQIVQMSHDVAFRAVPTRDAGFSQVYRRAVHETAHQWFGHRLGHGVAEDRAFLIESLAKYAELVLIERRYGHAAMQSLVDYEVGRYRDARIDPARDVLPLIDAEDNVDQYSRASIVFACARQKVGDDAIFGVLRQAYAKAEQSNRVVTSLEVAREIIRTGEGAKQDELRRLLLGTEPVIQLLEELQCR